MFTFIFVFPLLITTIDGGDSIIENLVSNFNNPEAVDPAIYEDAFREPTATIKLYGYPVENHTVITKDGYILKVHRIPNNTENAIPIMLVHGIGCSSEEQFTSSSGIKGSDDGSSVAYQLYDNGFDVWILNWRGGPFTSHQTLTKDEKEFWDFTWEDVGDKDVPATVDLILDVTKKSKVFYLGKSLGSTAGFAFFSSRFDYTSKMAGFVALAPVAFIQYAPCPECLLFPVMEQLAKSLQALGQNRILQVEGFPLTLLLRACSAEDKSICEIYLSLLQGWNPYLHNQSRLGIVHKVCGYGSSAKMYMHLGQINRYRAMRKFDYGSLENMKRYNSDIPPLYNLTDIKVPVVLVWGSNDAIGHPMNVAMVERDVKTIAQSIQMNSDMANHADTTFTLHFKELYMKKLIAQLKSIWN